MKELIGLQYLRGPAAFGVVLCLFAPRLREGYVPPEFDAIRIANAS